MRTYHFHTIINGRTFLAPVQGSSVRDAVSILRGSLRDGETIVGWA